MGAAAGAITSDCCRTVADGFCSGRDGRRDGGPEPGPGDEVGVADPDETTAADVEKKSDTAGLSAALLTGEEASGKPANGSSNADTAAV